MVCLSHQVETCYRPRQPRQSPLYRLVERYYPEFERTYDDHYEQRYGHWRTIIGEVARRFLRCGDLHFGFARVRCDDGGHEMFVPFSCQQRCLCPSCHQKRSLLAADTIVHTICAQVPYRQLVFTISGFSVDNSVYLSPGDTFALDRWPNTSCGVPSAWPAWFC